MTGKQLMMEGIERASEPRRLILLQAQACANTLGLQGEEVSAVQVRDYFDQLNWDWASLGNAAGAIFRSPPDGWRWVPVGWRPTTAKESHTRPVRVWKLERKPIRLTGRMVYCGETEEG